MKICHVNLASGFSGGERQTLLLIKQLVRQGHENLLIANPQSELGVQARKVGCHVIYTKHFMRQHKRKMTKGFDLIHVHEGKGIYWAFIQRLIYRIPYIITRRIDNPIKKKFFNQLAYRRAQALVGLSQDITQKLEESYPNQNVVRIPSSPVTYSVNQDKLDQIWNRYQGKFLVLQAANMFEHKGFEYTIQAAKSLGATHPHIQFLLVGDGEMRNELEQQAKGLTNVSFMGYQPDMGTWFAAANLFIHPAKSEGLGSVILEAMQAGIAVVASDAGGISDIVKDQKSGLLFENGNVNQLISCIEKMEQDEALRLELIQGAKKMLTPFDITNTTRQYEKLYHSAAH